MSTFTETITINAPVNDVWATLADIGSIHEWNPGVRDSYTSSEASSGIGASRHCDLGGRNYLKESVVAFAEHERLTMRIDESNMPFAHADIRFDLTADGDGTRVDVSPDYTLKYGPVGALMDRLVVRRMYTKGMAALLRGLKRHVEATGH